MPSDHLALYPWGPCQKYCYPEYPSKWTLPSQRRYVGSWWFSINITHCSIQLTMVWSFFGTWTQENWCKKSLAHTTDLLPPLVGSILSVAAPGHLHSVVLTVLFTFTHLIKMMLVHLRSSLWHKVTHLRQAKYSIAFFKRAHNGAVEDLAFEHTHRRFGSVGNGSLQVWTMNEDCGSVWFNIPRPNRTLSLPRLHQRTSSTSSEKTVHC
jgi:hypothetical protein